MEEIKISVLDFTEDPGPRYIRQDREGEATSGEAFYIYHLNAVFTECLKENKKLIIELDGVSGYPSSFLDEAIGELVYDFTLEKVSKLLDFETVMFKKRVLQVKDETYSQWEIRRKNNENIIHSNNINQDIFVLGDDGKITKKHIS